jgi:hypothetical protein
MPGAFCRGMAGTVFKLIRKIHKIIVCLGALDQIYLLYRDQFGPEQWQHTPIPREIDISVRCTVSFRTPEGPSIHTWLTLLHWSDWYLGLHGIRILPYHHTPGRQFEILNLDPRSILPRFLAGLPVDTDV